MPSGAGRGFQKCTPIYRVKKRSQEEELELGQTVATDARLPELGGGGGGKLQKLGVWRLVLQLKRERGRSKWLPVEEI